MRESCQKTSRKCCASTRKSREKCERLRKTNANRFTKCEFRQCFVCIFCIGEMLSTLSQKFCTVQERAIADKEECHLKGRRKELFEFVLKQETEETSRNGRSYEEPGETGVCVALGYLPFPNRTEEPERNHYPIRTEECEQHERRREMCRNEEYDEEFSVLIDRPPEHGRE